MRDAQGWTDGAEAAGLPIEQLPARRWVDRILEVLDEERESIHVFGSPFERSKQNLALALALAKRRMSFLVSEPYSPVAVGYLADAAPWKERLKVVLRPKLYSSYGWLMRRRLSGVFAISPLAETQYGRMGIAAKRIFPFGYFVPLPSQQNGVADTIEGRPLRIAYLGSGIQRKGVDVLLRAMGSPQIRDTGSTLTLFGRDFTSRTVQRERWLNCGGALPFGQVFGALSQFDIVIVPSLYDGWAVVVNEAIGAGVPVVASDMVGAGALLEPWRCGLRYGALDSASLARIIVDLSADRTRLAAMRANTAPLAACLQPEVAGRYMAECIDSVERGVSAPLPPWQAGERSQ